MKNLQKIELLRLTSELSSEVSAMVKELQGSDQEDASANSRWPTRFNSASGKGAPSRWSTRFAAAGPKSAPIRR